MNALLPVPYRSFVQSHCAVCFGANLGVQRMRGVDGLACFLMLHHRFYCLIRPAEEVVRAVEPNKGSAAAQPQSC